MNPFSLITGAVQTVFGGVKDIILGHVKNDQDKIEAALQLGTLQLQLQEKLVEAGEQYVDAQKAIIVAEAQSASWLPRNIRPLSLAVFLGIIIYQGVVVSIFHLPSVNFTSIPTQVWTLFTIGFGGYIVSRGVEKSVANWASNGTNGNGSTDN